MTNPGRWFDHKLKLRLYKPLPHMQILGSPNSTANRDMMSKILTNGDTFI